MSPKFRGSSEDWLDNDELSTAQTQGSRPKKNRDARSSNLDTEAANALVAEVFPKQCRVKLDEDSSNLLCSYRRAGVVGKSTEDIRERTPVAVGDRVLVTRSSPTTGRVEGLCVRKNCLSRPAPGRDSERFRHVLAANIDILVIVVSTREPAFSLGLVDRVLVSAEVESITSVICVTKTDLLGPADERPWDIYRKLGYQVIEVSSKADVGIGKILKEIEDRTAVFCGQSGVGKTSLLNKLIGTEVRRVGGVNESTGKGRHTTTGAILLEGPKNSKWIDTPGVREFGLFKVEPHSLANCFPEFRNLSCQIPQCCHLDEPGCSASHLERYSSYRRILESLLAGEN